MEQFPEQPRPRLTEIAKALGTTVFFESVATLTCWGTFEQVSAHNPAAIIGALGTGLLTGFSASEWKHFHALRERRHTEERQI